MDERIANREVTAPFIGKNTDLLKLDPKSLCVKPAFGSFFFWDVDVLEAVGHLMDEGLKRFVQRTAEI